MKQFRLLGFTVFRKSPAVQVRTNKAPPSRRERNGAFLRAFGGAANKLVMQALRTQKISTDEIQEIRKMLDDLEGDDR